MEENTMKYLVLILFLCLLSCKSMDIDPTATILKHILTQENTK